MANDKVLCAKLLQSTQIDTKDKNKLNGKVERKLKDDQSRRAVYSARDLSRVRAAFD